MKTLLKGFKGPQLKNLKAVSELQYFQNITDQPAGNSVNDKLTSEDRNIGCHQ